MRLILGIESSCDETAASVTTSDGQVLSDAVASQIAKHSAYGGVIPELAAREHLTAIGRVVNEAMTTANVKPSDLSAVAVTHAPGLVPALLVGIAFAKGFAAANNLPLIGINHFLAHIRGAFVGLEGFTFDDQSLYPMAALVVSGGHTSIVIIHSDGRVTLAGTTLDDAAGEAFDKAAKMLNLGYPGGPVIERLSKGGDPKKYHFPRSLTGGAGKALAPENRFNFSFSGVKTALLYHTRDLGGEEKVTGQVLADSLASYQEAIVDVLCSKLFDAAKFYGAKTAVLCGGVACNSALRARFAEAAPENLRVIIAQKKYCTDNAVMVSSLAHMYYESGIFADLNLDAIARLPQNTFLPFGKKA